MLIRTLALVLALSLSSLAQTARRSTVTASGEGVVTSAPDQARVTISVQTRGATAQQASEQNAQQTTAVLTQLRQLLGQAGDIRTTGYSIYPEYTGTGRTLVGYVATNSVTATMNDTSLVSRVLDGATQAGANLVAGVQFLLKDYAPARAQALRQAAQQARSNAEAIANGLGMSIGAITAASDTYTVRAIDNRTAVTAGPAASGTPTPIEVGTIEVRATVTVEAELR